MAIYGVGANYDGKDVSGDFVAHGIACIGWDEQTAPGLHYCMRRVKQGSIIYIKAQPVAQAMTIKAVGIVLGEALDHTRIVPARLGEIGVEVGWLWHGIHQVKPADSKYNVHLNTFYEEFDPAIINSVLRLLRPATVIGSWGQP